MLLINDDDYYTRFINELWLIITVVSAATSTTSLISLYQEINKYGQRYFSQMQSFKMLQ